MLCETNKNHFEELMKPVKFIAELKRRNVIKSGVAYLAVAWVLLQVFSILLPLVEAPLWVLKTITLLMIIGFPVWIMFSWVYEVTPEGIKKTKGVLEEDSDLSNKKNHYNYLIIAVLSIALVFILIKPMFNTKPDKGNVVNVIEKNDSNNKSEQLTSNLKALDFYLKGEFHQKKETPSDIDTAIVYYNKAIENDPKFAKAYSNLAAVYMRKYLSFDPNTKWEEEAYSAAGKALLLNPNLANPHIIKGQFYWSQSHNFAHEEAFNEFVKAVEKNPELSLAYEQLSLVQLHIGLFDDALKNAQKSIDLDPGNFRARRFIGEILLFQGNYNSALKEFEKIPENFAPQPTQSFEALNLLYLKQPDKAIELLNNNLQFDPNNPNLNSVYAIILAEKRQFIEAEQRKMIALENSREYIHAHHIYYNIGVASALMNKKNEAVEWLDKAANTGFPNYPLFNSDPYLKNLKGYKGYEELLKELKEKWEYYKTL